MDRSRSSYASSPPPLDLSLGATASMIDRIPPPLTSSPSFPPSSPPMSIPLPPSPTFLCPPQRFGEEKTLQDALFQKVLEVPTSCSLSSSPSPTSSPSSWVTSSPNNPASKWEIGTTRSALHGELSSSPRLEENNNNNNNQNNNNNHNNDNNIISNNINISISPPSSPLLSPPSSPSFSSEGLWARRGSAGNTRHCLSPQKKRQPSKHPQEKQKICQDNKQTKEKEREKEGGEEKQAEIARKVAIWASIDEKKKSGKGREREGGEGKGEGEIFRYRSGGVGEGEFILCVWKTNNKVRGVNARMRVVFFGGEGGVFFERFLELGKQDIVAKSTFTIPPPPTPSSPPSPSAEILLEVSFPLSSSSPSPLDISITLQQTNRRGEDSGGEEKRVERGNIPILLVGGKGEEEGGGKEGKRREEGKGVSVYRSLGVTVVSGRKFVSHSNLYATVHVGGGFGRTATMWNCKEQPVWKSHFDFRLPRNLDRYTLYTTLWEISDKIGRDAPVGQAKIPLCKFVSQDLVSDWFGLEGVDNEVVSGKLRVQLVFEQQSLLVRVLEGTNLAEEGIKMKGMFVFIRLGERVQHTKVVQRSPPSPLTTTTTTATTATTTTTPVVFGEEFVFVSDGSEGEVLVIGVVSDDEQHFFGQVKIPLTDIRGGKVHDHYHPLSSRFEGPKPKSFVHKKIQKIGDLKLELQYTETTILGMSFYQELLDLLISGDGLFLEALGKTIPPSSREKLSKILAKIYRYTGTATKELTIYAAKEIKNTSDPRVLFRGNTLVTKLIDSYQKLLGGGYVRGVLGGVVKRVFGWKRAVELDPGRVEGKDVLGKNLGLFEKILNDSLGAMFSSVGQCPEEMRMIYSKLNVVLHEHFSLNPEPSNSPSRSRSPSPPSLSPKMAPSSPGRRRRAMSIESRKEYTLREKEENKGGEGGGGGGGGGKGEIVKYTVVNSFLILRLFVPAFLTPTAFQLSSTFPPEHTARSLTLLGKTIQNLANFTFFSEKDQYMMAVNGMILKYINEMKEYYERVAFAPMGWEERGMRKGIYLERELALLHELVREHHSEFEEKMANDTELLDKIMNACHIVVKKKNGVEVEEGKDEKSREKEGEEKTNTNNQGEKRNESRDKENGDNDEKKVENGNFHMRREDREVSRSSEVQGIIAAIYMHMETSDKLFDSLEQNMRQWEFEKTIRIRDDLISKEKILIGLCGRLEGRGGDEVNECLKKLEQKLEEFQKRRPKEGRFK